MEKTQTKSCIESKLFLLIAFACLIGGLILLLFSESLGVAITLILFSLVLLLYRWKHTSQQSRNTASSSSSTPLYTGPDIPTHLMPSDEEMDLNRFYGQERKNDIENLPVATNVHVSWLFSILFDPFDPFVSLYLTQYSFSFKYLVLFSVLMELNIIHYLVHLALKIFKIYVYL